jgi:Uma2 family endonuclease
MAAVVEPEIHRMTIDEYEQFLTLAGLDTVELIDGVIYDVSPESVVHLRAVEAIYHHLRARFPDRMVFQAGSVRLDEGSLWNPDVFVVDSLPDDGYPDATAVQLVVEVAVNTWSRDTGPKLAVYARNKIPEYWVINPVPDGVLQRYTEPEDLAYRLTESTPLPDGLRSLDL